MDSPIRVPPDESRGEAEKRKKRILNAPPLNKPLPKGYMLVSKISETLKLCVSASLVDYRLQAVVRLFRLYKSYERYRLYDSMNRTQ